MKAHSTLFVTLVALATVGSSPAAPNWGQFRGPNGDGVASTKGLPAVFDDSNTAWKIDLPPGWSSPVLWQDQIIVTAETSPSKRAVLCLSASDGSELWRHEVPFAEHRQHKFNSFASSTPFVDANRIYITWTSGTDVQALALSHDGKLLWETDAIAHYVHEHGSGVSPVVADGVLIVRAEFATEKKGTPLADPSQMDWKSHVIGLDAATGTERWNLELPNTFNPYSTPTVRKTKDGKTEFIIANTTSGLVGIDATSGDINWQHNPGYDQRSVGSIQLKDDIIFAAFGSGDGGKESALLRLGTETPEELTSINAKLPYVPTPLIVDDLLYLLNDGGILSCVTWPTGDQVFEPVRLTGASGRSTKYFSSPVAADGKIYCCSQTGEVVTVKSGASPKILGVSVLDSPINASPAIGDNALYIRTEKSLYRINAQHAKLP